MVVVVVAERDEAGEGGHGGVLSEPASELPDAALRRRPLPHPRHV